LSKRHGATSVMEYARQGYLPEAMVNFLALLGWSPGSGDQELFTRAELTQIFDLGGINRGNAVFNPEKLEWFNQQHIFRLAPDELARRLRPSFEAAGFWDDAYLAEKHAWFFAVLELLKPRAKRLDEFAKVGAFFFTDTVEYDEAAVQKHLRAPGMDEQIDALLAAFAQLPVWDAQARLLIDEGGPAAKGVEHRNLSDPANLLAAYREVSSLGSSLKRAAWTFLNTKSLFSTAIAFSWNYHAYKTIRDTPTPLALSEGMVLKKVRKKVPIPVRAA